MGVLESYHFLDTAFIVEDFGILLSYSFILEGDLDTLVKESHLTHSVHDGVIIENRSFENFGIRPESCLGSGLSGSITYYLQRACISSLSVFLVIYLAVSSDLNFHLGGKSVNYRCTYAMETAGYLVSPAAEFTAGMEHSMDNFHSRDTHLGMLVYRHTTSVIFDGDGIVLIDGNFDVFAVSCESFIYTVIYDLIDKVMKTSGACGSDVHTGSLTDGFKSFQNLYLRRIILAGRFFF